MRNGRPKTLWMFSGQGSQYYQMGLDLYESHESFRRELETADRIAQRMLNESLIEIVYRAREDRFEPFDQILHSHPALLMIEYALARVLLANHVEPDALFGYSLGELTARLISGAISLEDAMSFAVKTAELIHYCAPAGKMLAVLHAAEIVEQYPAAFEGCEIAAHNFPGNFIVAGPADAVGRLKQFLASRDINTIELPVAHPFHSSLMAGIRTPLRELADQMAIGRPRIPVLSALNGEPVETGSPERLLEAMSAQVDFGATLRTLERSGPWLYLDLGPSGSLATTVKYNLNADSRSEILSIITRFGQAGRNLQRLLDRLNSDPSGE